jgi:CRP/FNR family cyclic AMP-dependent transcriptional regulator
LSREMPIPNTRLDPEVVQRFMPEVSIGAVAELVSGGRSAVYDAGEIVVGADRPLVPGMVLKGNARLIVRARDGREATLRTIGPGAMFGLSTMFEAERSQIKVERSIIAIERSTVLVFGSSNLRRVAYRNSDLAMCLVRSLADSASRLTDSAGQFAFMTVRQRLATYLLAIAAEEAGDLVVRATQQQLASSVGSVREVVARTLHDLRAEGLISVARGRVSIVNRDQLSASATM